MSHVLFEIYTKKLFIAVRKLGIERNVLNTKGVYEKPTANTLNGESLKAFPLRSGKR